MGVDPRFLEFLVGSLSSGVLAVDGEGHVQFANAAARRILRLAHGDAMLEGAHCRCVLGDQPQLAELLMSALAGGEMLGRAELALRSYEPGKPALVIGLTITSVRDQAENVVGASVVDVVCAPASTVSLSSPPPPPAMKYPPINPISNKTIAMRIISRCEIPDFACGSVISCTPDLRVFTAIGQRGRPMSAGHESTAVSEP